jgi:hypothetical protein
MLESLVIYFKTFIHPWNESSGARKTSYIEVLGISWALHLIYTFYSVFAVFLGVKSYQYFSTSEDFTHLILNSFSFSFQKISLFVQLGMVILYPVVFHFSYRFWMYLLGFYIQIFNSGFDPEEAKLKSEEIVNTMYTSNSFLLLPIAGAVFSGFSQVYLLYRGVVVKLNFTKVQAFLVLLTPLFMIFILAILIVSYLVFLFSLL